MGETAKAVGGMNLAKEIHGDRQLIVRRLQKAGKKVLGYMGPSIPLEILSAVDIIPFRIFGDMEEPISRADKAFPVTMCPCVRSCFDLACKGRYDFLDGYIGSHYCDAQEKASHIWKSMESFRFFPYLDMPHTTHPWAEKYFKSMLVAFGKQLESYQGRSLSVENLRQSIEWHNQQRRLVKELYELRKNDPPLISGTETLKVLIALSSVPVAEGNVLLREVLDEIKARTVLPAPKPARILVWGDAVDNVCLTEAMEEYVDLVMDDTGLGAGNYFAEVEATPDPFDGLAHRYLVQTNFPRTFRENRAGETGKARMSQLEDRFSYLEGYVKEWKVDGIVLLLVRFCDPYGFEVPALRAFLNEIGIPNIYLESDYSNAALPALKTRIQAFAEMIAKPRP